jgi:diguanylate cyclase (GGDEF)-like protein
VNDEPANILMVDDRPENLLALEAVLEPLGQNLVRANSGEEALRRLLVEEFAVILLDVQMPGLDGFETAAHIKQREKTRHIPIIFLTAISKDAHHALRGYTVGAVDYIFKPFEPSVLRSKVSVFVDLYRLKRQAEDLAHRALHDSLTGLPNRVLFSDRLQVSLNRTKRRESEVAVIFVGLDGFERAGEQHGHDAAEAMVLEVATRLRRVLRPHDTVARFGGDRFAILSEGVGSEADVREIAERIRSELAGPIAAGGGEVRLGASIGVVTAPDADSDPAEVVRAADRAMQRARQRGGGCYEVTGSRGESSPSDARRP